MNIYMTIWHVRTFFKSPCSLLHEIWLFKNFFRMIVPLPLFQKMRKTENSINAHSLPKRCALFSVTFNTSIKNGLGLFIYLFIYLFNYYYYYYYYYYYAFLNKNIRFKLGHSNCKQYCKTNDVTYSDFYLLLIVYIHPSVSTILIRNI